MILPSIQVIPNSEIILLFFFIHIYYLIKIYSNKFGFNKRYQMKFTPKKFEKNGLLIPDILFFNKNRY